MSLQLLFQASGPTKIEENKQVSPTLVVGLGGTGKEVLLRLRRMMVESYGSLDALPFVQFLHLDTDGTAVAREQYDLKADEDPLYGKVRFTPAERVDLTIEGGTGRYVEHINTYPHIKRWFQTDGKLGGLGNLGEGAGQIRMASRLGFYHAPNFGALASQLERARSALRDAANSQRAREHGFDLDPSHINVFVAASIAGGTGGGTFLDMGFLLQRYFPGADRVGIFLLPNFFRGYAGANRVRANGYAALMELNHYSFGHSFLGAWDGTNRELLSPPPYSTTYLIDATNEAGLEIPSSGKEYDAYRMCAEFLFQDFSASSFAGMKRAVRVNLVNFNLDVYTHNFLNQALSTEGAEGQKRVVGDTYPTRFGSFGLASISFPTQRVHAACACRLARRVMDHWEQMLLDDPRESLFRHFLSRPEVRFLQGSLERRDGGGEIGGRDVEDALLWYDEAGGKSFPAHIWERAQNIRGELEAAPNGEKAALLARRLEELDQALAHEDSTDRDEWGSWVRTIDSNMRRYEAQVRQGINDRAKELADDSKRGVAYTLSLLRELKAVLRSDSFYYLDYFSDSVGQWVDETQRYGNEVSQIKAALAKHERSLLFRRADVESDLDQLVARDDEAEDLGALYGYLFSRVMKQVAKRGLLICRRVDELLGADDPAGKGLIAQYYQLLLGFQALKEKLRAKEAYFSRSNRSELVLSLYREGDVDDWYERWMEAGVNETEVIKTVGNSMLAEVFEVANVTQALDRIQSTPPDVIEAKMVGHCQRFFGAQDNQPQALAMLMDSNRFSSREREELVSLAYRLGKVWMAASEEGRGHMDIRPVSADQRPCLIGVDFSDPRRLQEFQRLVRERVQASGDSPPAFKSLGEGKRGEIIFYNELAGVPAFHPSSIRAPQGLKEAYESYEDKDELHSDKNRFQFSDLTPKRPGEAQRYAEALKAFVLGRLLGLLRVKDTARRDAEHPSFSYSFKRESGLNVEEIALGDEPHAVDFLYRDPREGRESHRRYLLQRCDEVINRLRRLRHLEVYALLLEFYTRVVYPPSEDQIKVGEDITLLTYSPNHAVLDMARRQIASLVSGEGEERQLREALARLRGKSIDQPLTYAEYEEVLEPYVKEAGKVGVEAESAVGMRNLVYRTVFALDLPAIDQSLPAEPQQQVPVQRAPTPPREEVPRRPCPECGESIDSRALFCTHCRNSLPPHEACPHCGEDKVPGDLEVCWRCGKSMPGKGQRIECQRCFSFTGKEEEFPCPVCGHSLTAETVEPEPAAASFSYASASADAEPTVSGEVVEEPPSPEPPPSPSPPAGPIQCPTCYEEVPAGPTCKVCGSPLAAEVTAQEARS